MMEKMMKLVALAMVASVSTVQAEEGCDACPATTFEDVIANADEEAFGYVLRVRVHKEIDNSIFVAKVKQVYQRPLCDEPALETEEKIFITTDGDCPFDGLEPKTPYLIFPAFEHSEARFPTFSINGCLPHIGWAGLMESDEKLALRKMFGTTTMIGGVEGVEISIDDEDAFDTYCVAEEDDDVVEDDVVEDDVVSEGATVEDVIDILVEAGVSSRMLLETDGSAPRRAVEWMVNEDEYEVSPGDDFFIQRFAIVTFYFSTDGDNWTLCNGAGGLCLSGLGAYLDSTSECSWYGIFCDELGAVSSITLPVNGLGGVIPWELGYGLPMLQSLTLSNNEIGGTIPGSLGTISSLISIVLSGNQLVGNPLPPEFAGSNITSINLDRNMLSGPFPMALFGMPKLAELRLRENSLTGALPTQLGFAFGLSVLDVASNQLEGQIPPEIGAIPKFLVTFDISKNQITGQIPPLLPGFNYTTDFIVSSNQLTGPIPESAAQMGFGLPAPKTFHFNDNLLTGTVPAGIGFLPLLASLKFEDNDITGMIAPEICSQVGPGFFGPALTELTVDCDEVDCDCCTNC